MFQATKKSMPTEYSLHSPTIFHIADIQASGLTGTRDGWIKSGKGWPVNSFMLGVPEAQTKGTLPDIVFDKYLMFTQCSRQWPCNHCQSRKIPHLCKYPQKQISGVKSSVETSRYGSCPKIPEKDWQVSTERHLLMITLELTWSRKSPS